MEKKLKAQSHRIEIRCSPEIADLAEALKRASGDATQSSLHRRLVVAEGRRVAKESPAIARILAKIEKTD